MPSPVPCDLSKRRDAMLGGVMGGHRHVRLFRNGPQPGGPPGDEAIIHRDGDRLVIEPVRKRGLAQVDDAPSTNHSLTSRLRRPPEVADACEGTKRTALHSRSIKGRMGMPKERSPVASSSPHYCEAGDALMASCSFWMRERISSNDSGLSSNIIAAMSR